MKITMNIYNELVGWKWKEVSVPHKFHVIQNSGGAGRGPYIKDPCLFFTRNKDSNFLSACQDNAVWMTN